MSKIISKEREAFLRSSSNFYTPPYNHIEEQVELPGIALSEGQFDGFGSHLMRGALSSSNEEVFDKFADTEDTEDSEDAETEDDK